MRVSSFAELNEILADSRYSYGVIMNHIRPHEHLIAWKESHRLCLRIYPMTSSFPPEERFGLTSQMRRSSYSVPMNIAEGNMKKSVKEKGHFFEIASASLEELHYQCVLARDLKYISLGLFIELDDHIQRTSYLIMKLRGSIK